MQTITEELLYRCTLSGMITKAQARIVQEPWPLRSGWRHRIMGMAITDEEAERFAGEARSKKRIARDSMPFQDRAPAKKMRALGDRARMIRFIELNSGRAVIDHGGDTLVWRYGVPHLEDFTITS